jgi:DNA-binding IclR family transcriptional regulator
VPKRVGKERIASPWAPSIDRAHAVLAAFARCTARQEMSDLSQRLGFSKSAAEVRLGAVERAALARDVQHGTYLLDPGVLRLAMLPLEQVRLPRTSRRLNRSPSNGLVA